MEEDTSKCWRGTKGGEVTVADEKAALAALAAAVAAASAAAVAIPRGYVC
jgi:hypothetical protein